MTTNRTNWLHAAHSTGRRSLPVARRAHLGALIAELTLLTAVALPTYTGGGFSDRSHTLLIITVAVALAAAAWSGMEALTTAIRSPATVVLMVIAGLSIISAGWTVTSASTAIRSGLVVTSYAGLLVVACVVVRRRGSAVIVAWIGTVAAVEAVMGLTAVSIHSLPDAERLLLVWRPGGTYQYAPALALLEAAALPTFWWATCSEKRLRIAAGATGAVLAGAVIGISGDRLGIALALAISLFLACAGYRQRSGPSGALVVAGCAATGAIVSLLEFNRAVTASAPGRGIAPVLVVLATALAAGGLSCITRGRLPSWSPRASHGTALAVLVTLGSVLLWRASVGTGQLFTTHLRSAGILHGRNREWLAAIQTWLSRPFLGYGAESYAVASASHQTIAISRYAHDLPLEFAAELGIPGLLAGAALYLTAVKALFNARSSTTVLTVGPLVGAFMLSTLLDWTWHLSGLTAMWAIATGSVIASSDIESSGSAHSTAADRLTSERAEPSVMTSRTTKQEGRVGCD